MVNIASFCQNHLTDCGEQNSADFLSFQKHGIVLRGRAWDHNTAGTYRTPQKFGIIKIKKKKEEVSYL